MPCTLWRTRVRPTPTPSMSMTSCPTLPTSLHFWLLIYFFTFTGEVWHIFSKSFDQLLEADGEDTNIVFSPSPILLGDHCMKVLHLAEPNFAWGQQPKPQERDDGDRSLWEHNLILLFIGQVLYIFCISSWYQPPPSNTPNMTSNCLSPAYNATMFTFLTTASPTSTFQIARNRLDALIALHTQVQHTLET